MVYDDITTSTKIMMAYTEINPKLMDKTIKEWVSWGKGPVIKFVEEPDEFPNNYKNPAG